MKHAFTPLPAMHVVTFAAETMPLFKDYANRHLEVRNVRLDERPLHGDADAIEAELTREDFE